MEKAHVLKMLRYSFIGGPTTIKTKLQEFQDYFNVDEFMITAHIYDQEAKLKSYEIFRNVVDEMNWIAKTQTPV
jgi:alkanesulfonate monooxygenase SsuD/methylene tetrahydromethanopterin reductase-like flavin-dependent oxidoreductase (luciferase family)